MQSNKQHQQQQIDLNYYFYIHALLATNSNLQLYLVAQQLLTVVAWHCNDCIESVVICIAYV